MTICSEIEKFQTLIVGLLGFVGVIGTLWINAKLARQQRRDELAHERDTLRTALIEELRINRHSLRENIASLKEPMPDGRGSVLVPTDPMDGAYRTFLARIGILSRSEVHKVMNAYLLLQTYYGSLFIISVPVQTSDCSVNVPAENVHLLIGMQERLIEPIDEAIAALE